MAQHQAFFPVETIHELLAHGPPFPIEQHPNFPVPVPDPRLGHLPEPLPECGAGIAMTPIVVGGPRTADGSAGAPLTHRIRGAQIPHHDSASARALEFFCEDVLQHDFVQGQVRHQALQLGVLVLQLFELPNLFRFQSRIPLLPPVERLLSNPEVTDEVGNGGAPSPPA